MLSGPSLNRPASTRSGYQARYLKTVGLLLMVRLRNPVVAIPLRLAIHHWTIANYSITSYLEASSKVFLFCPVAHFQPSMHSALEARKDEDHYATQMMECISPHVLYSWEGQYL